MKIFEKKPSKLQANIPSTLSLKKKIIISPI